MTRPITEDELDIQKMERETSVSEYKIRRALDLPLSDIERRLATMLRNATTPSEIVPVILMINPETTIGRRAVKKLVAQATTREEIIEVCDNIPSDHSELHRAHEKLVELSGNDNEEEEEEEEEKGDDEGGDPRINELLQAYDIVPSFSVAEERLIVKLAKFFPDENHPEKVDVKRMAKATNIAESSIRFALKVPPSENEQLIASLMAGCKTREALLKISQVILAWSVLGLQATRQHIILSNRDELKVLAGVLSKNFPLLSEVYNALLARSSTLEEVLEVYRMIPETRAADEDKAIIRLAEFFLKPKKDTETNP